MKKLSLRLRLTLATTIIIAAIAVMLTLVAMQNANTMILQSAAAMHAAYEVTDTSFEGQTGSFAAGDMVNADSAQPFFQEADLELSDTQSVVEGVVAIDPNAIAVQPNAAAYNETAGAVNQWSAAGADASGSSDFMIETAPITDAIPGFVAMPADSVALTVPAMVSVSIRGFNEITILYMLIIMAAGAVVTWFVLGRALRPVKKLSSEIAGISENDLNVRITEFQAGDEINSLADSFNHMMERLERVFENQKGFASAAAHELKTPLASIKARIDVMELSEPDIEDYKRTVEVAKKQTNRMIELVDDLFQMSSTSQYEFSDSVSPGVVAQEIVAELKPQIRDKNLSVEIHDDTTEPFLANEGMLRRALENVIENAVKYNKDDGSVDIHISQVGKYIKIEVADTGIGIPEEQREKIFDAFYRVDDSRSRKTAGAGLGLAIAKKMVENHGGEIQAASREDGGTIIEIILTPVKKA